MKTQQTNRGFDIIKFIDNNGVKCSLQKSSSALEDKIWLGVTELDPKIMCSDAEKLGLPTIGNNGWQPFNVPSEVMFNDRMHLTQEHVQQLLPFLQKFAETGELN